MSLASKKHDCLHIPFSTLLPCLRNMQNTFHKWQKVNNFRLQYKRTFFLCSDIQECNHNLRIAMLMPHPHPMPLYSTHQSPESIQKDTLDTALYCTQQGYAGTLGVICDAKASV